MTVAFNNTPGTLRTPLFYAEVNPGLPPFSGVSRLLLIGRRLTVAAAVLAGGLAPLSAKNIGSVDPNYLAGRGSMLAEQIVFARAANPTGEIWVMDPGDPTGAVASTGGLGVTGTATSSGVLVRYVAGRRYEVVVAVNDSAATVAANLAASIGRGYALFNRRMGAPVTAAASSGNVTLTALHTGSEGNAIRIEAGLDGDEIDPAGLTVTITPMSGGAGDVDMAATLAALGATQFDWIQAPYNSVGQLNAARDFLSDSGAGRWAPTVQLDGHYITHAAGNVSTLTSLGATRNDRHTSIIGLLNYPNTPWAIGAAVAGWTAFSKNLGRALSEAVEIARPLQTLVLQGIRPPKALADRWAISDTETLYANGISALSVNADGTVAIQRLLTTYQTNLYGQADQTFLGVETIAISAYVKRYFKQLITTIYPRHVLKDDNPGNQQGIVTPDQIRATIIHGYRQLYLAGLVEKPDLFAQYLVVERSSDPNRINAYLPIDVANQFIVFAANITIFPELSDNNASLL